MVLRFCGLTRLPSARTVVNCLKQFTAPAIEALPRLNSELMCEPTAEEPSDSPRGTKEIR